jgi:hypothetical protein
MLYRGMVAAHVLTYSENFRQRKGRDGADGCRAAACVWEKRTADQASAEACRPGAGAVLNQEHREGGKVLAERRFRPMKRTHPLFCFKLPLLGTIASSARRFVRLFIRSRAIVVRHDIFGIDADGFGVVGDRLVELAHLVEGVASA